MLDLEIKPDEKTSIAIWKMEEELTVVNEQAATNLIDNYVHLSPKRQREKAFVNLLLQQRLPGAHIGYHADGKPKLDEPYAEMGISISHTGDYACLMLSKDNKNIGIDIERNHTAKVLRVRHKFMAEAEVALHPTDDEGTDALLAWTTKEALFKLTDTDHYDLLEAFRIVECHFDTNEGYSKVEDQVNGSTYTVRHLLTPAYALSYCIAPPTTNKQT